MCDNALFVNIFSEITEFAIFGRRKEFVSYLNYKHAPVRWILKYGGRNRFSRNVFDISLYFYTVILNSKKKLLNNCMRFAFDS